MSPARLRLAVACLAICCAPPALAQATPEQKAYAESQKQKREAAQRKQAESAQKQQGSQSQDGPRTPESATSARCVAHPRCMPQGSSRNVCHHVEQTYNGTGAVQVGMQDIVARCRAANAPDPCGSDARGTPGTPGYRYDFKGGCAEQCPQVAHCTPTDRR
ncbi:MAG: hypothetical protein ACRET8_04995 [Burkholderiales bacterium]